MLKTLIPLTLTLGCLEKVTGETVPLDERFTVQATATSTGTDTGGPAHAEHEHQTVEHKEVPPPQPFQDHEGERVAGVAKCGTYGTIPDEELGGAGSAAAAAAAASADNFDIPSLGLQNATRVLSDRVTELRQGRAMGTAGVVFSEEDLAQLRDEFDLADPGATGTIACGSLGGPKSQLGNCVVGRGLLRLAVRQTSEPFG